MFHLNIVSYFTVHQYVIKVHLAQVTYYYVILDTLIAVTFDNALDCRANGLRD